MDLNQTWDREGNLIESVQVERPETPLSSEDRLAQVEAMLEAISTAESFAAAKAAISERRPVTDRETKG
jgi:hypothetical protein